ITNSQSTRRDFLRHTGGFLAGLGLSGSALAGATAQPRAPSERIKIGVIGIGPQGRSNMGAHIRDVVAVCDVDRNRLAEAKAQVEHAGGKCTDYGDYRRLLENRDVDAVIVSTP